MRLNKVRLSRDATIRVQQLKGRTGLTPNVLCRFGLCVSLEDDSDPRHEQYDDAGMEFNRYTLTGQWDLFFFSLLRERLAQDGMDLEADLESQFKAHLSRGVLLLYQRLKSSTAHQHNYERIHCMTKIRYQLSLTHKLHVRH